MARRDPDAARSATGTDEGIQRMEAIRARVEALGGTIQVHSPAGQGTRLQIDLPIQDRPSS